MNCGYGMPGSHNDINILDSSPLFKNLLNGKAPKCTYKINGKTYENEYYLCDFIYPDWSTLVKTISQPQGLERKHIAKMQEVYQKDVERAFGVLQARFAIVSQPARSWSHDNLKLIMKACIILHNMIVEDERSQDLEFNYDGSASVGVTLEHSRNQASFSQFISHFHSLQNAEKHNMIRNDLIKHLWALKGRSRVE